MCSLQMKSEETEKLIVKENRRLEYQCINDGSRLLAIKRTKEKSALRSFPYPWNRHQSLASWNLTSSRPRHSKAVKCPQLKYPAEPDTLRRVFPYSLVWNYYLHLHKSKPLVLSTLKCMAALGSSKHLTTCCRSQEKSTFK